MANSEPVVIASDQSAVPVSLASVPSHAVTNAGTFAVQASEADGANVTLGAKADAKSTATDTTAVSAMSVLKQISASVQAPPSQAVTNAGTFAVQSTPVTQADTFMLGGVNIKEINAVTPLMGNGVTGTGSQRVTIASDNTPFAIKTDQTTHGTTDLVAADITKVAGTAIDTNSGNKSAGTQRVVIATDQPTVPVSLASVPSHAVTNAGTFAIQDSEKLADNAAFTDGTTKVMPVGYIYDEVAGTALTENDIGAARMNVNRALVGAIEDGATRARYATVTASNALKVDGSAVTQPVSIATNTPAGSVAHDGVGTGVNPMLMGGYASAAAPTNVSADGDATRIWLLRSGAQAIQPTFAGVLGVAGNGVAGTGVQRVTLASDSTGNLATIGTSVTPGTSAAHLGKAEDAAHTTGDTGVMSLGVRKTSPTDLSAGASDGDYEPFQVNRDGGLYTVGIAAPTGGWSIATGSIAATKTDIGTANTAGQVVGWYIYNPNATVAYVQFFNAQASAVTLGTTAPVYSLGIPGGAAANLPPGVGGLTHATAISIAVTTTRAGSTGTGSTVDYNIWYKQ